MRLPRHCPIDEAGIPEPGADGDDAHRFTCMHGHIAQALNHASLWSSTVVVVLAVAGIAFAQRRRRWKALDLAQLPAEDYCSRALIDQYSSISGQPISA